MKRNSENVLYYNKLLEAKQITSDEDKVEFFGNCRNEYTGALAPRRLQLNYASGDTFKRLVDEYLKVGLHKGVPPLFVDLRYVLNLFLSIPFFFISICNIIVFDRSLYAKNYNVEVIESLLKQYIESLKKTGSFSPEESDVIQPACALLWTYYYAAQHYDYLGDTAKALEFIDLAIEHTPTLIELFIVKGRIYKVSINADF